MPGGYTFSKDWSPDPVEQGGKPGGIAKFYNPEGDKGKESVQSYRKEAARRAPMSQVIGNSTARTGSRLRKRKGR